MKKKETPKNLIKGKVVKIKCIKSCATVYPEAFWKEGVIYSVDINSAFQLMQTNNFIKLKLS